MMFLGGPPSFHFENNVVSADGMFYSLKNGGGRLDIITIYVSALNRERLDDIWVQTRFGEKVRLLMLNSKPTEYGFEKTPFWREEGGAQYANHNGLIFYVDQNDMLTKLSAYADSSMDSTSENNPRMGSFSSGKSFSLPCSAPEMESVFGKPDKMYSYRSY